LTQELVIQIGRQALITVLLVAAPALITGMTVGLLVSIFQSVTQIQEFTLTFVPKILAVVTAFLLAMPWMLNTLLGFIVRLYSNLQPFAR
jgi:flagellar biosynthetic protein FliQ